MLDVVIIILRLTPLGLPMLPLGLPTFPPMVTLALMVPLAAEKRSGFSGYQWYHWLPMIPLVKFPMVPLGESRTHAILVSLFKKKMFSNVVFYGEKCNMTENRYFSVICISMREIK